MNEICGKRPWLRSGPGGHSLSCRRLPDHLDQCAWEPMMAVRLDLADAQEALGMVTATTTAMTDKLAAVLRVSRDVLAGLDVDPGTTRYSAADVIEWVVRIGNAAQGIIPDDGPTDVGAGAGDPGGTGRGAGRVDRPVVAPPVTRRLCMACLRNDCDLETVEIDGRWWHMAADDGDHATLAERIIADGMIAFQHTREYLGEDVLPAIDGWSWWDWCKRATAYLRRPALDSTSEADHD